MRMPDGGSHSVFIITMNLSYIGNRVVVVYIMCCVVFTRISLFWFFLFAFICRTERLQDFTERFSPTTLVNKAENQTARPHKKGQKRVYVDESSSKTVSNSKFYFYMTQYCYRQNWFQYLQRMLQNQIPLKSYYYRPQGRRTIGRLKKRWRERL